MEFELMSGAELSDAERAAVFQALSVTGLATAPAPAPAAAGAASAWRRAGNEEAVDRGVLAEDGDRPGRLAASGYVPPARRSRGAARA